jgi:hypothetical protein
LVKADNKIKKIIYFSKNKNEHIFSRLRPNISRTDEDKQVRKEALPAVDLKGQEAY